MRKLTTTAAAMAVALAAFGQNPGFISATKTGQAVTMHSLTPPTDNSAYDLLKCRMEVTWYQSDGVKRLFAPCPCSGSKTVHLPTWATATTYEVRRRCFWQTVHGTVWKWGNAIILN